MESMSINPAAAAIGLRLVDVASGGTGAGAAALPSLTGLAPAGAEEISMLAAMAFAAEAQAMLALNAAAQEELARAGVAVTDIARMYAQVDGEAASTLMAGGSRLSGQAFSGGRGVNAAPTLAKADTLPGATGQAARTPLLTKLIEGVTASNPATTVPAGANAAATVIGAGTTPLSSLGSVGQGAAASAPAGRELPRSLDQEDDEGESSGKPLDVQSDCFASRKQDNLTRS